MFLSLLIQRHIQGVGARPPGSVKSMVFRGILGLLEKNKLLLNKILNTPLIVIIILMISSYCHNPCKNIIDIIIICNEEVTGRLNTTDTIFIISGARLVNEQIEHIEILHPGQYISKLQVGVKQYI